MPHHRIGAVYMDAPPGMSQMHFATSTGEAALAPFAVPIPITQEPPTVDVLTAAPPEERVEVLRARLFPLIQELNPRHAMIITEIILEMNFAEVLYMLENPGALSRVAEEVVKFIGEGENGGAKCDKKIEESGPLMMSPNHKVRTRSSRYYLFSMSLFRF